MNAASSSSGRLSGWALRQLLAGENHAVSDRQLDQFVEWGLLDRNDAGYAPDSYERVVEILEAGRKARSMPRRVVMLRSNFFHFPVPTEALQRALVEFARSVERPIRKMQVVDDAWRWMAAQSRGDKRLDRRSGRLPTARDWPAMLKAVPLATFDAWTTSWYYLAREVLPAFGREVGLDLESIALEERVVIVAVLDQWRRRGSP